jgi:MFS family permease
MSFIGMFLGASIAGIAADRFGRKVSLLIRKGFLVKTETL